MKRYFIYNIEYCESSLNTGVVIPTRITIVFCPFNTIEDDSFKRELYEFLTTNNPPNKIIIIGGKYCIEDLRRKKTDKENILKQNTSLNGIKEDDIEVLFFDENGNCCEISEEQENKRYDNKELEAAIKSGGLLDIFIRRNGILDTESSYHFVLPSGKHSNMFIRAGNLLTNSSEISFIAFCLLKYYTFEIQFVYCDTASIFPIIYALIDLKKHFDKELSTPCIDSFSSYEGMKDYEFNSSDSIAIISATTSGRMKNDLISQSGLANSKIISLFVLNEKKSDDPNILLDLSLYRDRVLKNISNLKNSLTEDNCEFCNNGSLPVRIIGDQFLPAKLKIKDVLFEKNDLPGWFPSFIKQFHSDDILKCFYGENGKTREIYINVHKIHSKIKINDITLKLGRFEDDYKKSYFKQIESSVPASLCKILILNDDASRLIAEQIKDYCKVVLGNSKEIEIIKIDELDKELFMTLSGTVFVVASCIASGRRLLAISRELRAFEKLSIVYFIGIIRVNDPQSLDVLIKNLEFRKDPGKTNKFISIQKIFLPDEFDTKSSILSLQKELYELKYIRDNEPKIDTLVSDFLDKRIEIIENASSVKGLGNELFYNQIDSKPLFLRKNFAFWGFDFKSENIKQSEVYFTVSALIHNIRQGCNNKTLQQHEHIRSLISPQNFHRFNDGIIQACLLRASKGAELDYKIDSNYSHQMKILLLSFFGNPQKEESEAILEFLYALYIEKMTLTNADLKEVMNLISEKYFNSVLVMFFVKLISQKILIT